MGLFSLFGPKKPEGDPYRDFDKDNHFKPRLDKGDFYKLTGYDFALFVLEPISKFIGERKYEAERGRQLSYGQKALYYWWYVDAQVLNGGFTQYYFNQYGKYTPTTIMALQHIGDTKMAELVNRSYELYLKQSKKIKDARQEGLEGLSGLYKEIADFESLDRAYNEINEKTVKNIVNYIRNHPDEICVDEEGNEFDMKYTGEVSSYYAANKLKQRFHVKKGVIDGAYNSYYENGKQKEVIHFVKGKQTGEREEYHENGNLKYTVRKNETLNQYEHTWYHENGNRKKLEHKQLDKDHRIGEYKEWYENGQLAESATFIAAIERDGWWLQFYSDGSKKFEAEFKEGEYYIHNCWNEKGEQIMKDGTGLHIHDFSGWPGHLSHNESAYKNYKRHGKQYTWTNGMLTIDQEMVEGKAHGLTKTYNQDGSPWYEVMYEHGVELWKKKF